MSFVLHVRVCVYFGGVVPYGYGFIVIHMDHRYTGPFWVSALNSAASPDTSLDADVGTSNNIRGKKITLSFY